MRDSIFGKKVKDIREEKGLSQAELARRLGHASNSYVRDIERGVFTPSEEKLAALARALGESVARLQEMRLEAKLREVGVRDPDFVAMLKDYRHLSQKDREAILDTYQRIRRSKDGPRH